MSSGGLKISGTFYFSVDRIKNMVYNVLKGKETWKTKNTIGGIEYDKCTDYLRRNAVSRT